MKIIKPSFGQCQVLKEKVTEAVVNTPCSPQDAIFALASSTSDVVAAQILASGREIEEVLGLTIDLMRELVYEKVEYVKHNGI
jgi:hypothetical protein